MLVPLVQAVTGEVLHGAHGGRFADAVEVLLGPFHHDLRGVAESPGGDDGVAPVVVDVHDRREGPVAAQRGGLHPGNAPHLAGDALVRVRARLQVGRDERPVVATAGAAHFRVRCDQQRHPCLGLRVPDVLLHLGRRPRPVPHAAHVILLQDTVEVFRGVVVVVVDEQLPDLFLVRHGADGGLHPRNRGIVEVERRGLQVHQEPGGSALQPVKGRNSVVNDLVHWRGDIHYNTRFIRLEFFQGFELRIQQRERHEMARTRCHAAAEQFPGAVQVHEHHGGVPAADDVAVGTLERAARDDQPGVRRREAPADLGQPGCPVVVVQRGTRGHLVDVRLRVQRVAVEEFRPQAVGDGRAHGAFAATGHAHDDNVGGTGGLQLTSHGRCRRRGGCRAGRPAGRGTRRRLLR
ncbi:hypothetical protein SRABI128_03393 [Microbacterium sp. Bi128]|nr:hypothetical protein SRABI128_03393 [Microbacterium sp. Bi128]